MTEEEKKKAEQKEREFQTGARVYGYLSDVVLQRYGIEWTRIGNMQSSAGALLTVISIASALGFGSSCSRVLVPCPVPPAVRRVLREERVRSASRPT